MLIKQELIDAGRYNIKSPYKMIPLGICVHNTANDAPAANEMAYMKGNVFETSFHLAVDDKEAIQAIPFDRNAWHAGDGGSGVGNRNYIAIEICYSRSGGPLFDKAEDNAIEVIAQLCKEFGWSVNNIRKHQDFSGKYCPHRTLDKGWQRFLDRIDAKINEADKEKFEREYPETGKFICKVGCLDFYNQPTKLSPIAGKYEYDQFVFYDRVAMTDKWVYISWISSSTGLRRYMPVRPRNGKLLGEIV